MLSERNYYSQRATGSWAVSGFRRATLLRLLLSDQRDWVSLIGESSSSQLSYPKTFFYSSVGLLVFQSQNLHANVCSSLSLFSIQTNPVRIHPAPKPSQGQPGLSLPRPEIPVLTLTPSLTSLSPGCFVSSTLRSALLCPVCLAGGRRLPDSSSQCCELGSAAKNCASLPATLGKSRRLPGTLFSYITGCEGAL